MYSRNMTTQDFNFYYDIFDKYCGDIYPPLSIQFSSFIDKKKHSLWIELQDASIKKMFFVVFST